MVLVRRYGYTPWNGAADYLRKVGADYTDWRYLLREKKDGGLSTTHPEALLEVARAIVRILESDLSSSKVPGAPSRPVGDRTSDTTGDKPEQKDLREDSFLIAGLDKALEHLKRHAAENQILLRSFSPQERESASAWMAITCGYSLLEQAVKSLLKRRENLRPEKVGRVGHYIDKIYGAFPKRDREYVEQGFGAYISLHDDIATSSASEYLRRIGRGYNAWRYLLVERPNPGLAEIHPGALLEITGLVSEILQNETFTDHGMHDVGRRLADCIFENIVASAQALAVEREDWSQESSDLLNAWMRQFPNVLTAYASYLRGEAMPESDLIREVLERANRRLAGLSPYPYGADLQVFLKRAADPNQRLIWDSSKNVFIKGQ